MKSRMLKVDHNTEWDPPEIIILGDVGCPSILNALKTFIEDELSDEQPKINDPERI